MGVRDAMDYVARALSSSRKEFVTSFPYPFLVQTGRVVGVESASSRGGPFVTVEEGDPAAVDQLLAAGNPDRPLVLPVRKHQSVFADMITLGRASNNDIVVRSTQISKFHAFFRETSELFELADAGSLNGTWIDSVRLVPKGPPQLIAPGVLVRFGPMEFQFLDAGAFWDDLYGG